MIFAAHRNATFLNASCNADGLMDITFGTYPEAESKRSFPTLRETMRTRFLIGADGARSRVAQFMGLEQNTHLLAAAEWLVKGVSMDQEKLFMIMNHDLAIRECFFCE
jgi:2-polyprenyl-6-methoxyphenol hydroxylase-like FAD-dependent oxidoreductase